MSKPRWPAMHSPGMIDVPGNDSRHNLTDANKGGSPRNVSKSVPTAQRGGFGQNGRDKVVVKAGMAGGRAGAGNPASRGGTPNGINSEARIPGHGGSPQHRGGAGTGRNFGVSGQQSVPTGKASNPQPGAGNTSGTSYRMIAGRFQRAAMGAKPTSSNSGKYGGAPVTSNT